MVLRPKLPMRWPNRLIAARTPRLFCSTITMATTAAISAMSTRRPRPTKNDTLMFTIGTNSRKP